MFGLKKTRMKEKKLEKFFFLVRSGEKKKKKEYEGKFSGKFKKISGKNFPRIFVRKTVKNNPRGPRPRAQNPHLNFAPWLSLSLNNPISLSLSSPNPTHSPTTLPTFSSATVYSGDLSLI